MATIPPLTTWSVGELPTSAILNSRIRDAINFLKSPPLAIFRKTANQNTSSGTWTAINWDVEDVDTDGGHSNVTNNTRYTAQTAGWYLVTGQIHWTANATGFRELRFRKNGSNTDLYGWNVMRANDSSEAADIQSVAYVFLAVNDYVEVQALQSSGGTLATFNDGQDCRFEVRWVRMDDAVVRTLPAPRTWSAGLWSVGHLNVDVRDVLGWLLAPPMAVLQKRNGNQEARKVIGNTYYEAEITWDTVVLDTHGGFDGSAPTRYTAPYDGWYHAVVQLQWSDPGYQAAPTGWHRTQCFRKIRGGDALHANYFGDPAAYESKSYVTAGHVRLLAGEYISVFTSAILESLNGPAQIAGYDGATFLGCRWDIRWVSKL